MSANGTRWYFTDLVGTGLMIVDPYRSAITAILPGRNYRVIEDARSVLPIAVGPATGRVFVEAKNQVGPDHDLMVADSRVTYIPLRRADDTPLQLGETLSLMSAPDRATLTTVLEAQHIPTHDFTNSTTCQDVLRQIVRRLRIRRRLGADDVIEGLDTTVGQITVLRSNAITSKLTADGFSFDGITTATTIRSALVTLQNQNNQYLVSEF